LHCAWVGGVVDVDTSCQSLTAGCGSGSDGVRTRIEPPPAADRSSHNSNAAAKIKAAGTATITEDLRIKTSSLVLSPARAGLSVALRVETCSSVC
jgi:hypothetical protein